MALYDSTNGVSTNKTDLGAMPRPHVKLQHKMRTKLVSEQQSYIVEVKSYRRTTCGYDYVLYWSLGGAENVLHKNAVIN